MAPVHESTLPRASTTTPSQVRTTMSCSHHARRRQAASAYLRVFGGLPVWGRRPRQRSCRRNASADYAEPLVSSRLRRRPGLALLRSTRASGCHSQTPQGRRNTVQAVRHPASSGTSSTPAATTKGTTILGSTRSRLRYRVADCRLRPLDLRRARTMLDGSERRRLEWLAIAARHERRRSQCRTGGFDPHPRVSHPPPALEWGPVHRQNERPR